MIECPIFLCGLAQQWGHDRNEFWNKGSLWGEDDTQMKKMHIAHACAEKARDTTLDDEKYNWPRTGALRIGRTCIVVTALCNQPEAFTLDLGDDQSCYL